MRTIHQVSLTAALVAIAALALPGRAYAQHSGVEIWANTCGRCHTPQPPNRYTAKDWTAIIQHMTLAARLTDAQRDAVLAFLKQGSLKTASSASAGQPVPAAQPVLSLRPAAVVHDPQPAGKTFSSLCAPCHGKAGKGDGPAAAGFNPRPRDFTDAKFWQERTDQQLIESITNGKNMMPAFGSQLKPEQIKALVTYLRTLGGQAAVKAGPLAP